MKRSILALALSLGLSISVQSQPQSLPVDAGGTGRSSTTAGSYLRGAGTSALEERTPAEVLGDIAAQAADATLTSLAALGTAADKLAYTTGVDTWAETPLTAVARALLDDVDAPAMRATIGAGTGDVTKVGTPVNNQIGVWTGNGTLAGGNLYLQTLGGSAEYLSTGITGSANFCRTSNGSNTLNGIQLISDNTARLTTSVASSAGIRLVWDATGVLIGLGQYSPASARPLEVRDATQAQIRATYTAGSVYTDLETNSSGNFLVNPSGGAVVLGANLRQSVQGTITASTTQTQVGGTALTADVCNLTTVANPGDAVTARAASAGDHLYIANNGANNASLFPAVGDNFGGGVDTAITVNAGSNRHFVMVDGTNWEEF